MSTWVLVLTHLAAASGGAVVMRAGTVRAYTLLRKDPPVAPMIRLPRPTVGVVVLIASVVLIVTGGQMLAAQRQTNTEQRQQAAQADQDRARAVCLDAFAHDLVDAINDRRAQNDRLAAAQSRKDAAMDSVVLAVAGGRARPPTATAADFDRTLGVFVVSVANLAEVKASVGQALQRIPYPSAACPPPHQENSP